MDFTKPIEFRLKQIYGKDTMYIVDDGVAACFRKVTGQKTLTKSDKESFERLGFTFKQVIKKKLCTQQLFTR